MTPPSSRRSARAFYFGCKRGIGGDREAGHFLYDETLRGSRTPDQRLLPWPYIDGVLAPRLDRRTEAPQGEAALHHKDGWTALSFWDRSGDSRGNSSSTFFFEATLTFEEALAEARERFPALFRRFPFEVVEHR